MMFTQPGPMNEPQYGPALGPQYGPPHEPPAVDPSNKSIRCAVFKTVPAADQAIEGLLLAGFRRAQISVVCSEEAVERHFGSFVRQEPAGTHTVEAAAAGGLVGSVVGGLALIGLTTASGLALLAVGPVLLLGGAAAGGFIGAMMTRGEEKTLADYYDQALSRGDLLVAVIDDAPGNEARLAKAEEVFHQAGAEAIPLEKEPQSESQEPE